MIHRRCGALLAAVVAVAGAAAAAPTHAAPVIHQVCAIASPPQQATIEVTVPNAADFCELFSQALGSEVFRGPTVVFSGVLVEYAGSIRTCELRYRRTSYEIVVSNSRAACAWLTRPGTGWHATPTSQAGGTYPS